MPFQGYLKTIKGKTSKGLLHTYYRPSENKIQKNTNLYLLINIKNTFNARIQARDPGN
jgi:hypothetical protein